MFNVCWMVKMRLLDGIAFGFIWFHQMLISKL